MVLKTRFVFVLLVLVFSTQSNIENEVLEKEYYSASPYFTSSQLVQMELKRFSYRKVGSSLHFNCNARGNPKPVVEWEKDGKKIVNSLKKYQTGRWSLDVKSVAIKDSGSYTCIVKNSNGLVKFTFQVEVIPLTEVKIPLKSEIIPIENKIAFVGDTVTINCNATLKELSNIEIRWYRSEEVFQKEIFNDATEEPKQFTIEIKTKWVELNNANNVLKIFNVSLEDSGSYACLVSNVNEIAWHRILLKVKKQDQFKMIDQKTTKPETITITIASNPPYMQFVSIVSISISFAISIFLLWCIASYVLYSFIYVGNGQNQMEKKLKSKFPTISTKNLLIQRKIGEGQFGIVFQAKILKNSEKSVAVKTLGNGRTSQEEIEDFIEEISKHHRIGHHKHVIQFLGCGSFLNGMPFIVLESAFSGNLKEFLQKYQAKHVVIQNDLSYSRFETPFLNYLLTYKKIMGFAFQIAQGMQYLDSKKVIHRDLAARNILVSKNLQMKISDFGLSYIHDSPTGNIYIKRKPKDKMPLKWMAPESISKSIYSRYSDVWSFGILLWEMVTLGANPYHFQCFDVDSMLQYLMDGYRMECPPKCPFQIYLLMRKCWLYCPRFRPDFDCLISELGYICGNGFSRTI